MVSVAGSADAEIFLGSLLSQKFWIAKQSERYRYCDYFLMMMPYARLSLCDYNQLYSDIYRNFHPDIMLLHLFLSDNVPIS